MERACLFVPQETRLQREQAVHWQGERDGDYVLDQRGGPRDCDGVYHQEAEGVWVCVSDDAVAACGAAEDEVGEGEGDV